MFHNDEYYFVLKTDDYNVVYKFTITRVNILRRKMTQGQNSTWKNDPGSIFYVEK